MRSIESRAREEQRRCAISRGLVWLLAAAGCLCVLVAPVDAAAAPGLTLSASLRVLYGAAADDVTLNPYEEGLGLRGGLTLSGGLYLGASLDYFFGDSDDAIDTEVGIYQVLGNVGYDFDLGLLMLRPSIGFGLAESSLQFGDEDESEGNFALSPGAELFLGFGPLNVSAELRYNEVFVGDTGADVDAVIFGLGLGLSL
ncbi:MAG TPA: outer membrane beta-barrel protein [Polyangiaceae bacterium]|nr:outer membrane beta-barrel protein [Polyangiaceae bacterium]